jgi:virginiamycin B lyase
MVVAVLVAVAACTGDVGRGPTPGGPAATATPPSAEDAGLRLETFQVPGGAGPHDVAPAADGGVWFTAQRAGYLGHLDPASRVVTQVPLGPGSQPHGVIVDADRAAWVTDSGLNAIVRVDGSTREVRRFPLPADRPDVHLNTAAFDTRGVLTPLNDLGQSCSPIFPTRWRWLA